MNTANSNNKVKQIVGKLKSVPTPAYLLIALNLIMLTSFVCYDLQVHYMLGMAIFTIGLVTILGQIIGQTCGCWQNPTALISDKIQSRIKDLEQKFSSYAKTLHADQLQSKTINTVIAILLIVHFGTLLNTTVQIFLLANIIYCLVFLPQCTDQCIDCSKKSLENLLGKIKYQK